MKYLYINLVGIILVTVNIFYFYYVGLQGNYPVDKDSIGIPIFTISFLIVVIFLIINVIVFLKNKSKK
jgi:membrane protein DedA with SNARE-associated domain